MKVLVVFDDTGAKSEVIADVIGDRGFADVVVKRKRLEQYYRENLEQLYPQAEWKLVRTVFEFGGLRQWLDGAADADTRVLHCFSGFLISQKEPVLAAYEKLRYVGEPYRAVAGDKAAAVMFPDTDSYRNYLDVLCGGLSSAEAARQVRPSFAVHGMADIGVVENFIQCVAGNFDSRYFNSLQGDEYTLVKSSANKKKIESEYRFWHLLPEDMKFWHVMPFDYREDAHTASYRMERMHMTDLAVRWVHGSVDEAEFGQLMDKYFYFFASRHSREVSAQEYGRIAKALYVDKVQERIAQFKKLPEYEKIRALMEAACEEKSIDALAARYFRLKERVEETSPVRHISVIGHGDPCFANVLYSKSTKTLKFIDPKGALTEEELWTDPYYDIAKLSHSVCGLYDFFNNALFEIRIREDFRCELEIGFDNTQYIKIFRDRLEENGYDYLRVRLYEASLFLSMLPLHMDYPHKVFGFILNVCRILKEIEEYV